MKLRKALYVGPRKELQGKTFLARIETKFKVWNPQMTKKIKTVVVQADDRSLVYAGGWHLFPRHHLRIIESWKDF